MQARARFSLFQRAPKNIKNKAQKGLQNGAKMDPKSRKMVSANRMCFSPRLEMGLEGCAGEFPGPKTDQAGPQVGPAGPKAGPTSPKASPTGPKGGPTGPKGSPTGGKVSESDRFEKSFKAQGLPYI